MFSAVPVYLTSGYVHQIPAHILKCAICVQLVVFILGEKRVKSLFQMVLKSIRCIIPAAGLVLFVSVVKVFVCTELLPTAHAAGKVAANVGKAATMGTAAKEGTHQVFKLIEKYVEKRGHEEATDDFKKAVERFKEYVKEQVYETEAKKTPSKKPKVGVASESSASNKP
ncbi:MAG TPA: hypothetical protein VHM20_05640, partial [Gammaproteobacteria bacterium]|nr:hypothetical protein [Gammaproteobacteria bacterium]